MTKIQWLGSIIICFFLFFVAIAPNGNSYFHKAWQSWLWPVASTLNINYAWQFFSPDPAAAVYYRFHVLKDNTLLGDYRYPKDRGPFLFRFNYTRRLSLKNVLFKYPDLMYSLFAPYYCKKHPVANYVKITKEVVSPLSFAEARSGRTMSDETKIYKEELGFEACGEQNELF